jgi:hypothetical protein
MHEINNNSSKNFPREHDKKHHHHHQSVHFMPEFKKKKAKRAIALAESEESIISASSFDRYAPANGFFEHAVVNFKFVCFYSQQLLLLVHLLGHLFFFASPLDRYFSPHAWLQSSLSLVAL